ncbi:MAG: TraM recognition domain-containing protein [Gemmataceae bacterium]|nr:TraM recognition domain-containing protein [Gemmataceae bacterium]
MRDIDHALYVGRAAETGEAVFWDMRQLTHTNIAGPTGSRKSSGLILGLLRQIVKRRTHTVRYLDLNGDEAMDRSLDWLGETEGIPVKTFTTEPRKPTVIYNPLRQRHRENLSLTESAEIDIAGFGSDHGDEYGKRHFASMDKQVFTRGLEKWTPTSYAELHERLLAPGAQRDLKLPDKVWDHSTQVRADIEDRAKLIAMNAGPEDVPPSVWGGRLELSDGIERPEINIAVLPTMTQGMTNRGVARGLVQDVIAARRIHPGPMLPEILVIDDGGGIMTGSLSTIFSQCRKYGVTIIYAHQTLSQLRTRTHDYAGEVLGNSHSLAYFGPFTDKDAAELASRLSGERLKDFGGRDGQGRALSREALVPRYGVEELLGVGRVPGRAVMHVQPGTGLAQFKHAIIVDVPFTMSEEKHQEILARPWPGKPEETIVAAEYKKPEGPKKPSPEEREQNPILKKLKRAK